MIYKQGDERTFDPESEEYQRLKNVAKALEKQSPNKHTYIVKDVYLDIGQNWMWTTIIDITVDYQILCPRDWLDIVNGTSVNDIIKTLVNGNYWQDKVNK